MQFPDNSWDLIVLKNIFLRFKGLKGLKMIWKKVPWSEIFFPDFGWKTCFSLISLTGKSLQNFPWFPWSVGTLVKTRKKAQIINVVSVFRVLKVLQFNWYILITCFPHKQIVVALDDKAERETKVSLPRGKLPAWNFCKNICSERLRDVTHLDDYEVKKI